MDECLCTPSETMAEMQKLDLQISALATQSVGSVSPESPYDPHIPQVDYFSIVRR